MIMTIQNCILKDLLACYKFVHVEKYLKLIHNDTKSILKVLTLKYMSALSNLFVDINMIR
jgi:hypothetical protein